MNEADPSAAFFWDIADVLLEQDGVEKGTIMGFPCLRVGGAFFACPDRESGDLVVKLPASRVEEMVDAGTGQPFAPTGRRFREWVRIPDRDASRWKELVEEALEFVDQTRNDAPDDMPITQLRNLGPASARMLESIDITTRADLERVGPVLAYRAVKDIHPGASLNLLYAMHGALAGERWDRLSEEVRAQLKREAEKALQTPPGPAS